MRTGKFLEQTFSSQKKNVPDDGPLEAKLEERSSFMDESAEA